MHKFGSSIEEKVKERRRISLDGCRSILRELSFQEKKRLLNEADLEGRELIGLISKLGLIGFLKELDAAIIQLWETPYNLEGHPF